MEGSEAYDDDDVELELNEVIEDNILDNEDIDIDYDVFIDEMCKSLEMSVVQRVILIYTFHNFFHEPFIFLQSDHKPT